MGAKTAAALRDHGAVYLHAVGGAAALLASRVEAVESVHMLEELGPPEAFWVFRVRDFPVVVTMDSTGASLHDKVEEKSRKRLAKLLKARPFSA